jgi:hypothetical protein
MFSYVEDLDNPPGLCILCKQPTRQRARYNPAPQVKIERPVCINCAREAYAAVRVIVKLRELLG